VSPGVVQEKYAANHKAALGHDLERETPGPATSPNAVLLTR
jgi:hypothetical protein